VAPCCGVSSQNITSADALAENVRAAMTSARRSESVALLFLQGQWFGANETVQEHDIPQQTLRSKPSYTGISQVPPDPANVTGLNCPKCDHKSCATPRYFPAQIRRLLNCHFRIRTRQAGSAMPRRGCGPFSQGDRRVPPPERTDRGPPRSSTLSHHRPGQAAKPAAVSRMPRSDRRGAR